MAKDMGHNAGDPQKAFYLRLRDGGKVRGQYENNNKFSGITFNTRKHVRSHDIEAMIREINSYHTDLGVKFRNCIIEGDVRISREKIIISIIMHDLRFEGGVDLRNSKFEEFFEVKNCEFRGNFSILAVTFTTAKFTSCQFMKSNTIAKFSGIKAKSFFADNCHYYRGVRMRSWTVDGAIHLGGTKLSDEKEKGRLELDRVRCRDLYLTDCKLPMGLFFQDSAVTSKLELHRSEIGSFDCERSILSSGLSFLPTSGNAIRTERVCILKSSFEGEVTFPDGGTCPDVRIADSQFMSLKIGSASPFARLEIVSEEDGDAATFGQLIMTNLMVDKSISVSRGAFFSNVEMSGLSVSQDLDLRHLHIVRPNAKDSQSTPSLKVLKANIEGEFCLPKSYVPGGADLSFSNCNVFADFQETWHLNGEVSSFNLRGFDYSSIQNPLGLEVLSSSPRGVDAEASASLFRRLIRRVKEWISSKDWGGQKEARSRRIEWIRSSAPLGKGSPMDNQRTWITLSSRIREAGDERTARKIIVERRLDYQLSRDLPFRDKFIEWILYHVAEYGFNPFKTLIYCLIVVSFFGYLYDYLAYHVASETPLLWFNKGGDLIPAAGGEYTVVSKSGESHVVEFNSLVYSLDVFIPVLDLGEERHWVFEGHGLQGVFYRLLFILERITGATLITISAFGFMGLLERERF